MTTNGMTLYRKKRFSCPINLPSTPSDMLEGRVIEYKYKDSKPGEDELTGLPEEFYAHLGVKHKKIKAYQLKKAPLNPVDPDLVYRSPAQSAAPEHAFNEVPSTPFSTPASGSEESSDAGLYEEDLGEEVGSEEIAAAERHY